jgi:2-iminobutanoate/2-iminopropanoate deaminase
MKKEVIFTDKAAAPGGWYSQAIRAGDFVFTAGVVGADPETRQLVAPGDMVAQTEQALRNLKVILEAAGSSLENVVKTTVFIDDVSKFNEFNEAYKKFFPSDPPGRSTIQVGRFKPGMCVEIEAIALVNQETRV